MKTNVALPGNAIIPANYNAFEQKQNFMKLSLSSVVVQPKAQTATPH